MASKKTTRTTSGARERVTIYDPKADNARGGPSPSRNSARAVANANAASMALLDAIRDALIPCSPGEVTWTDAHTAQHTAHELLNLYASLTNRDSGETFDLPSDDGRELPIRFTLEDF
jgi:hypothetical protein